MLKRSKVDTILDLLKKIFNECWKIVTPHIFHVRPTLNEIPLQVAQTPYAYSD